jgi:hypothetical protein
MASHSEGSTSMPQDNSSRQNRAKKYDFPSVNIVFDLIKDHLGSQMEQVDALDSKANFILVSATTLLSAALVIQAVSLAPPQNTASAQFVANSPKLLSYCLSSTNKLINTLPLLVLFATYLLVTLSAFLAYKIGKYQHGSEPNSLFKDYLPREESDTKAEVAKKMLDAYNNNILTIKKKARRITTAFVLLGLQIIALIIYLIFQITC